MKTIAVRLNVWGNYACYISGERQTSFAQEWDAQEWLNSYMSETPERFFVSTRSDLQPFKLHSLTRPISAYQNTPDDAPIRLYLH